MINNPTHLQIVDTEFLQNEIERQQSFLLYKTIFSLNETNIKTSVKTTISLIDSEYTFSFNKMICRLIYSAFLSRMNQEEIYFQYLNLLQDQIKQIKRNDKGIFEILSEILLNIHSNESYYLLEKMIQQKYIKTKMIQEQDFPIYKEVSNNDNEIHNQLILEGVNPNEISKIIRNDEIEKLQEITSQNNFNFNQMIKPSVYERFSFINKENIPLINYAAFFGSIECFKYLLLNGAKLKNTGKYAIAGGNLEIIHLCEQNHSSFEDAYETSIEFHRNDIFKYLYDNNILSQYNLNEMSYKSIFYNNYEILLFLKEKGSK